ncbi:MAG: DUF3786 domain-containing protein [Oscillospiraceae bacterium]|nr:DUF3786 domain-containing protein [Oscillospiraceae bacterium]
MAELPNNKENLPQAHYRELYAALDPSDVAKRTGIELQGPAFAFDFLGHRFTAAFPEFELMCEPPSAALTGHAAQILVLRYLIRGAATAWQGKFLSYRELPWGEVYDANFNGRCRIRLARTYGKNLDGFRAAAENLGGTPVKAGDAAADLPLPGGITVRVILREGDDEFPATSQFLFSDNIVSAWDAEDLAALGEVIISALKEGKV